MENLIKIKETVIGAESVNSVNAREVYEYLEIKTKFADWIKRTIEKYDFKDGEDYMSLLNSEKREIGATVRKEYIVTLDMAKELCIITDTPKGKEVRKYFIQCEKELNKPLSEIEMAERYLANLKRIEALKQQNVELEKTKAWISDKKTATAMNTASQYSKENKELKIKLDEHKEYSTIRRQEKINNQKFKWRPIKKYCMENGLTIKDTPDDLYEFVKSYPAEAWLEVYEINIKEQE